MKEEPTLEERWLQIANAINKLADEVEQMGAAYVFGEREIRDYVLQSITPPETRERAHEEIMATALAEAIQDVFSADKHGIPHPEQCPYPTVEKKKDPPCVETAIEYCGFSAYFHLVESPDGSFRLSIAFFGRCRDRQKLLELSETWSQSPLSEYLSVEIDEDKDALVLSGDLLEAWCNLLTLRMDLKHVISGLVSSETNAPLLDMLDCFDPI